MSAADIRSLLSPSAQAGSSSWSAAPGRTTGIIFGGGLPDPETFPIDELVRAAETALREDQWALQYGGVYGYEGLRGLLIEKIQDSDGVPLELEQIVLTSGSAQALSLACFAFLAPRDVVIVEAPTWVTQFAGSLRAIRSYKLIHRYEAHGEDGLLDRSRAPHDHPNATPRELAERIVEAKCAHPTWGPKKLIAWLRDIDPGVSWPAPRPRAPSWTARGLCSGAVAAAAPPPGASPSPTPHTPTTCGRSTSKAGSAPATGLDPLTVQDAASRYLIACQGLERPTGPETRRALARAFQERLPQVIRTDNGPPFASVGLGSLSPLSAWWIKLGIVPERIEPGHPEQNGRLERLHRTLKAETASPPRANRRRQRRAFDHFRHSYNNERPHEALGQRPPVRLYTPSFRPYPSRLSSPDYGAEVTVRRVRHNGEIKWKGDRVYVSASLRGEPIGLVQQDERTWSIQFGPLLIGVLDDHARRIDKTSVHVLPMSPV